MGLSFCQCHQNYGIFIAIALHTANLSSQIAYSRLKSYPGRVWCGQVSHVRICSPTVETEHSLSIDLCRQLLPLPSLARNVEIRNAGEHPRHHTRTTYWHYVLWNVGRRGTRSVPHLTYWPLLWKKKRRRQQEVRKRLLKTREHNANTRTCTPTRITFELVAWRWWRRLGTGESRYLSRLRVRPAPR